MLISCRHCSKCYYITVSSPVANSLDFVDDFADVSLNYLQEVSKGISDQADVNRKWFWSKLLDKLKNKSAEVVNKLPNVQNKLSSEDVSAIQQSAGVRVPVTSGTVDANDVNDDISGLAPENGTEYIDTELSDMGSGIHDASTPIVASYTPADVTLVKANEDAVTEAEETVTEASFEEFEFTLAHVQREEDINDDIVDSSGDAEGQVILKQVLASTASADEEVVEREASGDVDVEEKESGSGSVSPVQSLRELLSQANLSVKTTIHMYVHNHHSVHELLG